MNKKNMPEKDKNRQLTSEEFKEFAANACSSKDNRKAYIGDVFPETSQKIETVCGKKITHIMVESEAVRHSLNKTDHNLRDGDLLRLVDVINTAIDIKLSDIAHQNNKCLEINKDIEGKITFVVEIRVNFGGWLALVTCYREKK
jgi:hypothetical protein